MISKKQFILGIFILAFGLALSGCFKQPMVNQNVDINTNVNSDEVDTSGWKTYRNEEYGFEFKYPRNWIYYNEIINEKSGSDSYIFNPEKKDKISLVDKKVVGERKLGFGASVLTISVKEYAGGLNDYLESQFNNCSKEQTLLVKNIEFTKLACEGYADPNYYIAKNKDFVYILSSFGSMNNYLDDIVRNLEIK